MKRSILFVSLLALGISPAFAQKGKSPAAESLAIGASLPMPELRLKATDGKSYVLGKQQGAQGLIVMFSCNTCPFVIKSQARTKEVMALAREKGLGLVIVNSNEAQRDGADSPADMKAYAEGQQYTAPYLLDDGTLARAFGATRTPEVFLFDNGSKLVYKGAMEDNPANPAASERLFLHEAVGNLTAGKAIDPQTTKSIGCTIKFK